MAGARGQDPQSWSFVERLWPPVWLVALGVVIAATLAWAVGAALGAPAGWAVLAGCVVLVGWLTVVSAPSVVVSAEGLRAGRAFLTVSAAGRVRALDAERTARLRTRDADPRAFLALRGWVPTSVVVEVADPDDPTPYWQVSSRRPVELADAMRRAAVGAASRPGPGTTGGSPPPAAGPGAPEAAGG